MIKWGCRILQSFLCIGMKGMSRKTQICHIGAGKTECIKDLLREADCHKPLFITGIHAEKMEKFREICRQYPDMPVYMDVPPEPTEQCVDAIVRIYEDEGCDSLIAMGGGSVMDAAKAAGACIVRPGRGIARMRGVLRVRKKLPFFIALPTTAGSGSEATIAAVIREEETGRKHVIADPALLPDAAILDPELTLTLPPDVTAWSAMDALTHAVEAYLNERYHVKGTKSLCEEAVRAIFDFLPVVCKHPDDLHAREELLVASYKAGRAFTTACVGNVHALAHAIGGKYHIAHGKANAMLLPIVLRAYGENVYPELAKLACKANIASYDAMKNDVYEEEEGAEAFINHICRLNEDAGIEKQFVLANVSERDIMEMAAWACKEANPTYPVPVIFSKWEMAEVLESAICRE